VICIHCAGLATIIAGPVCVFVVHIIRDPDLAENHGMVAHILEAFLSKKLKLVTKAVPDGSFSNLDRECRCEVLATKDANHVDIINPVPEQSVGEIIDYLKWDTNQCFVRRVNPS
jgi:ethanolamine utilization protein EutP (predicted NTPase)